MLPHVRPVAVAAPGVGGDEYLARLGVALGTNSTPPGPDGTRRKDRRVVVDADADEALAPTSTVDHVGLILSIPCEVASGSVNASVGRSTLATCPVLRRSSRPMRSWYVCSGERRWPSDTIPSPAQRTARLVVLGFELSDHSLGLVVEGGDDLVGVLFRVVKSQAAGREIDDFMTVPRSRPG